MKNGIISLDSRIVATGNAVGKKEYDGPLGKLFDTHDAFDRFGKDTWEKAESEMQRVAFNLALKKAGLGFEDIGAIFAGDLLNQCIGSSYGHNGCMIPYFGLYGACSTSGEGLLLAGVLTTYKIFDRCAVVTSSHNCAAERQYRTPIEYGGQRSPTSQWTVTGAGAFIVGDRRLGKGTKSGVRSVRLRAGMAGRVIDKGINDVSNMGAAMAPAIGIIVP